MVYQAMACWPEIPPLDGLGNPGRQTICPSTATFQAGAVPSPLNCLGR